ncbi:MAG: ParB/Srx family N-terminal domain-containing protein [Lachnospiraceae bacterium]|nr:ParB/Srx family N-terminal domain-containing protein [Lachnospiraceae bacterium]
MDYIKIPINNIELDLENPRIKQWLEMYGDEITSEGIALALTASGGNANTSTYTSLKESIRVNNGIINPIIVNRYKSGKLVVIEGNTRLQIYKEFAVADPEGPWNEIIAMVYDDLESRAIHAIRLQTHLVGPRDWDPFSKAKYLNQLCNVDKLPMSMIVSFCGGKSVEIRKLIDAYTDMMMYYFPIVKEAEMDPDPREFSKFAELQNAGIKQALAVHKFSKDDFAKWVVNGNIDTAQNVRRLPAILSNTLAREAFLKSTISEAIKYLNADEKGAKGLLDASMNDLIMELIKRCRNVEYKHIKALRNDPRYEEQKNNITELLHELQEISADIESE